MVLNVSRKSIDHLNFQVGCKLLHVLVQYFLVATYFWMFCEGLYLHTLLVVTFLTESKVMPFLHTIGWGIPALLVSTYAVLRTATPGETLQLVRFRLYDIVQVLYTVISFDLQRNFQFIIPFDIIRKLSIRYNNFILIKITTCRKHLWS